MSGWEQRQASSRRRVRWVYLKDAWPDAEAAAGRLGDIDKAILAAPSAAVEAAYLTEVEKYGEVIEEERAARKRAERELAELRAAVVAVLESAAPGPVGQLRMAVAS